MNLYLLYSKDDIGLSYFIIIRAASKLAARTGASVWTADADGKRNYAWINRNKTKCHRLSKKGRADVLFYKHHDELDYLDGKLL